MESYNLGFISDDLIKKHVLNPSWNVFEVKYKYL